MSAQTNPSRCTLLDITKPHVAEAVAIISPAVPSDVVDAIAVHLASVSSAARPATVLGLIEALQIAAEAYEHETRDKAAGITAVALDMAIRRRDGAPR